MSLTYFNTHYRVVDKFVTTPSSQSNKPIKQRKSKKDIITQADVQKPEIKQNTGSDGCIDDMVLDELFGGA